LVKNIGALKKERASDAHHKLIEGVGMENNFWEDRTVFITGCTGFLGSWLTKYLVDRNANVVGLVRDWVPKSHLNQSGLSNCITTVRGEVEDYLLLDRCVNEYEVDTVFHLAAQTIVPIAYANPLATFKANIEGTWNVLEASRRAEAVRRIIVASSDKAYGNQDRLPYDEGTPLQGCYPYDVSKSCADLLCNAYFETFALPVCVTRCGNFYGGGDLNFNRIVPGTIRSILREKPPIIRSDGSFVRDYFYIKDGAESYLLLAEKMENRKIHGEAFNFSTEQPLSVMELMDKILNVMNSKLEPIVLNEAVHEIKAQYLSAKKAKELLRWRPQYTIEEGLKETVHWYADFFAGTKKDEVQ
jgi:CDP-glucose 4,6-dehydratase